ncbi:hypothetical protein [Undibacterium pigrum]|uniref:Uncharacterized protein n=1 Tax=Undibacterium pigrum TaxID=401470 RepID=A0A318ILT8_9BURK|nr:hypothetical protein [Undibacterium pigrum]PXX33723.1 hypothetical protein DFR42_12919 [Undibacterium pigrum]
MSYGFALFILGVICGWINELRARHYEPDITHASAQYADRLYRRGTFEILFWKSSIRKLTLVFEREPEDVKEYVSSMRKTELMSWLLMILGVILMIWGEH